MLTFIFSNYIPMKTKLYSLFIALTCLFTLNSSSGKAQIYDQLPATLWPEAGILPNLHNLCRVGIIQTRLSFHWCSRSKPIACVRSSSTSRTMEPATLFTRTVSRLQPGLCRNSFPMDIRQQRPGWGISYRRPSWNPLSSGITFSKLKSVFFTDASTGYAVGSNIILKTVNAWTTWTALTSGTSSNLWSVYFPDADTGYTVGDNGTMLRTINGGGFPVGLTDLDSKSNTIKIYPNPSSTEITIETSSISTQNHLSIMSLSGQQLFTRQITESKTVATLNPLSGNDNQ